jgi:hypothetical protein
MSQSVLTSTDVQVSMRADGSIVILRNVVNGVAKSEEVIPAGTEFTNDRIHAILASTGRSAEEELRRTKEEIKRTEEEIERTKEELKRVKETQKRNTDEIQRKINESQRAAEAIQRQAEENQREADEIQREIAELQRATGVHHPRAAEIQGMADEIQRRAKKSQGEEVTSPCLRVTKPSHVEITDHSNINGVKVPWNWLASSRGGTTNITVDRIQSSAIRIGGVGYGSYQDYIQRTGDSTIAGLYPKGIRVNSMG